MCAGEKDPVVTAEQRAAFAAEMSAANVDWQLLLLGGAGHSRSLLAMQNLFDEVFGARAEGVRGA